MLPESFQPLNMEALILTPLFILLKQAGVWTKYPFHI